MKGTMFDQYHQKWVEQHLQKLKGEARRRLQEGHNHAEQAMLRHIWFPAFGHFQHLHPEYEIQDFNEGYRYIDLARLKLPLR